MKMSNLELGKLRPLLKKAYLSMYFKNPKNSPYVNHSFRAYLYSSNTSINIKKHLT
ncbi:hypothetical protein J2772_002933 [Chryseobacterium jejuense]|nr:hypothetical protein [Chryseobacterium jejuense]